MSRPLSKSAVDALGRRLKGSPKPTVSDIDLLLQLLRTYERAQDATLSVLSEVLASAPETQRGVFVSHRVKTIDTLVDKLRRESPRLSQVQDVVGIRVVGIHSLATQSALAASLRARWPSSRSVDRREAPTHGYRAVHVIASHDGVPVEVQLRTGIQHAWASATEAIADRWGRGIRYGDPPTGHDAVEIAERTRRLAAWRGLSDALYEMELVGVRMERAMALARTSSFAEARSLHPSLSDELAAVERAVWERAGEAGPDLRTYLRSALDALDRLSP